MGNAPSDPEIDAVVIDLGYVGSEPSDGGNRPDISSAKLLLSLAEVHHVSALSAIDMVPAFLVSVSLSLLV